MMNSVLAISEHGARSSVCDEAKAIVRKHKATPKEVDMQITQYRKDGLPADKRFNGRKGFNDYGEFIAATVDLNKLEREEHLVAAFRYFDKDGSGYITVDELQQACAEHNMTDVLLEDIIREVDQDNIVQQIQNMMTHDKSDREMILVRRMLQDGLLDVVCLKH